MAAPTSEERPKLMMRQPKITMITHEEYERKYWPLFQQVLTQIITSHESVSTYSQEELYRNVYNVCCQRHTVQLYMDLINLITAHLRDVLASLQSTPDETFVVTCSNTLTTYKRVVEIIASVFRYMDKVYVMEKYKIPLSSLLFSQFNRLVASTPQIKERLEVRLKMIPPNTDPTTIANLVKGLYELDKGYAAFSIPLFALFIPCLQPCRGFDIDAQEVREMVNTLLMQGYNQHEPRLRKRKYAVAEST